MKKRVGFVWVKHYDPDSFKQVERALKKFEPDIVGLELDAEALEKLLRYKKKDKSEMFLAYKYAVDNGKRVELLDTEFRAVFSRLLEDLRLADYFSMVLGFVKSNTKRIMKGEKPKKLKVEDNKKVSRRIVKERDDIFIENIQRIMRSNKRKKILFLLGKAHREGVLKGLT